MTPQEDATMQLSTWQRERDLKTLRLRKIERWRYKALLASFDNHEPGEAPYGVGRGP
jgi:hypothetical protein